MTWKTASLAIMGVVVVVGALVLMNHEPVQAQLAQQPGKGGAGPRYSVVETQGHNLLVTDNAANKLYFYTIEKDKEVGSPLKLRASLDLTQVGKDEITITSNIKK